MEWQHQNHKGETSAHRIVSFGFACSSSVANDKPKQKEASISSDLVACPDLQTGNIQLSMSSTDQQ